MSRPFDPVRRTCLRVLGAAAALPLAGTHTVSAAPGPYLYKTIPASGRRLPAIGIGTSRVFNVGRDGLAGPRGALEVLATVPGAMIDTSPMYGRAEQVVGELTRAGGWTDRFFYATKVWAEGRAAGIAEMNRSFELLQRPTLDLMQVHNLLDWQTHLPTLRAWKEQGRIGHIGITHYHESAHADLARVIGQVQDLDFLQVNYSLLEPEAADHLLGLAADRGIAVIANRPFARGAWFRLTRGQALPGWASELEIASWAQFALKWIVSHPAITVAIPGTGKARHMQDNLGAALGPMPDAAQRRRMSDLVARL